RRRRTAGGFHSGRSEALLGPWLAAAHARQTTTQRNLGVDGLDAVDLSAVSLSHSLARLLGDDLGGGTGLQFLRKRRCAFFQGLADGAGRRPGVTTFD